MSGRRTASQMAAASAAPGRLVRARLAGQTILNDERGGQQPSSVAMRHEAACPVVRPRAGLHTDSARPQTGEAFMQPGPSCDRAHRFGLVNLVHPVRGGNTLGGIDVYVQNSDGLPLSSEWMRVRTVHRGTSMPVAAVRPARGGEVPAIH